MVEITLGDGDSVEWALKAFKRKMQRAGVLKELRRRRAYEKPSAARQRKAQAARRRSRSAAGRAR